MKQRMVFWLALAVVLPVLSGCASLSQNRDLVFQNSTINGLMEGVYDGDLTCGALRKHGDFGIGTFDALDGEMVVLDGRVYQVKSDGVAYPAPDSLKTPLASVTFFRADKVLVPDKPLDFKDFEPFLMKVAPSANLLYAVKIEGEFSDVKTRSVPRQNKPYPRLIEAVRNQPTFEFHNVRGTVVGFWMPEYVKGINVPGCHLHFLTEDRRAGGHLLDFRLAQGKISIDYLDKLYMRLPENGAFFQVDLKQDKQAELRKIEK